MSVLVRIPKRPQPLSYTGWSAANYLSRADATLDNEPMTFFAWASCEGIGDGASDTVLALGRTAATAATR